MKIAVVGKGLIGSAAARHLAKTGADVTLIGPDEVPGDYADHPGSFASHYDEGRITRKNDRRPYFVRVSAAAIGRYAEIAAESGIEFFTEAGALLAGGPDYMSAVAAAREGIDISFEELDRVGIARLFPFLAIPEGFTGIYEPREAGHISPRRLVAAQTEAARRFGARIVPEEVIRVDEGRVITATQTIDADQVIVAAGGWTDSLLGREKKLEVYARTVTFHEIGPDEAHRLANMPTIVMESPDDIYILPPIRYADGKLWLKLGGDPEDVELHGKDAINDWFRTGGSAEIGDYLTTRICEVIPGLRFESRFHKPCVTTWSTDRIPEIRRLASRLIIAAAGNGSGAKCSDELGRMAAAIALEDTEVQP
ncbi:NAD(P)/FAD-dependent oxidoreductase [Silicimonas sp. MF1-12-2]|uniref:NAD(P)/FAD-dependent oxidoreductase n=1 Tax=Silicimonas sp. MF1-12-2 TaxID=3384793 RepID=UPI0039B54C86